MGVLILKRLDPGSALWLCARGPSGVFSAAGEVSSPGQMSLWDLERTRSCHGCGQPGIPRPLRDPTPTSLSTL